MRKKRFKATFNKKHYIILRTILVLLLIISLFSALDKRIRPVVTTMSQYQCRVISVLAMNEAVSDVMLQNEGLYEKLVETRYSPDGTVSSISVNSIEVNRVKEELTKALSNKLLSIGKQKIGIPIGTLSGWQLLAGRGPNVSLTIIPASYVSSQIIDKLESAGINQTQHRIFIEFSVEMSAILPGYSTSVEVESEMCIAQTLIVGKVPQLYSVNQDNKITS